MANKTKAQLDAENAVTEARLLAKRQDRETVTAEKQNADRHFNYSIKEQLEARVKDDILIIDIPRDSGIPIKLRFNKLTKKQLDEVLASQRALGATGQNQKKAAEEGRKIFNILEEKSLDGLTADYWESGEGFSADVLTMILMALTAGSVNPTQKYMEDLKKFLP